MKFSKYNEYFELNGNHYLYNILSTALAEIDPNICDAIKKNSLASLDDDIIIAMKEKHFIVEDDFLTLTHFSASVYNKLIINCFKK